MAKLGRYLQKLFGSTAGTNQMSEFGSLASGTPARFSGTTITPDDIQALSNYLGGWRAAQVGAGNPAIEDMNSLCYLFAYQLAYLMENGVPEWNAETTYYIGSLVSVGGTLYKSLANNNLNNAVTDGTKWTSTDTQMTAFATANFTEKPVAESNHLYGVAHGLNRFVAVSIDGTNRVQYSLDGGLTWTTASAAAANEWTSICYGNSLFVAVAQTGSGVTNRVMTSPQGITWTGRNASEANSWQSVDYGAGVYCAVASDGTNRVMTSTDGTTWTNRSAAHGTVSWFKVRFANNIFVAVGYGGGGVPIMTSPDGITWTTRSGLSGTFEWKGIAYGNGIWVACRGSSDSSNSVGISLDNGVTWTEQSIADGPASGFNSIVFGGGLFVAFSSVGIWTSPDAVSWTRRNVGAFAAVTRDSVFGQNIFVGVSDGEIISSLAIP